MDVHLGCDLGSNGSRVCSVKYMAILKFPNFIQMELILNWNRS